MASNSSEPTATVLGKRTDSIPEIAREFHFTRSDFDYLRKLVSNHTGIILSENKYDMLYSRLVRRIRHLGLSSFAEYVELIRSGHQQEFIQLVNAITTNLTHFFREPHHFDYLRDRVLPTAMEDRCLRIWSAGCATGEEPYSIAITLLEALPANSDVDLRVLATDLDSHALQTAREGVFPVERIEGVSLARRHRWFLRGKGGKRGDVRVKPELQRVIQFNTLNLIQEWPIHAGFNAIFCRNVLIYFDKPTKDRIVERFANVLQPGGYLFLGHSESLIGATQQFEAVGRTSYRRIK
ncbi:MAG: protein-glutamate O-methyltransferase CheR [Candidatus Sedimenticola sp. (ex Thyasira tokunagai)]